MVAPAQTVPLSPTLALRTLASAVLMDKVATKRMLESSGIPMLRQAVIERPTTGLPAAGALALPALRRRQPTVGSGRLWGANGVAVTDLTPHGTVRVRGETWTAESMSGRLPAGAAIEVMEVDGLHLRVWSDAAVGDGLPDGPENEERP